LLFLLPNQQHQISEQKNAAMCRDFKASTPDMPGCDLLALKPKSGPRAGLETKVWPRPHRIVLGIEHLAKRNVTGNVQETDLFYFVKMQHITTTNRLLLLSFPNWLPATFFFC